MGANTVSSQYWSSNSPGIRSRIVSAPLRPIAWRNGPIATSASSTATSASGTRSRMPSASNSAGRSWPAPMSAVRTRTRTRATLRPGRAGPRRRTAGVQARGSGRGERGRVLVGRGAQEPRDRGRRGRLEVREPGGGRRRSGRGRSGRRAGAPRSASTRWARRRATVAASSAAPSTARANSRASATSPAWSAIVDTQSPPSMIRPGRRASSSTVAVTASVRRCVPVERLDGVVEQRVPGDARDLPGRLRAPELALDLAEDGRVLPVGGLQLPAGGADRVVRGAGRRRAARQPPRAVGLRRRRRSRGSRARRARTGRSRLPPSFGTPARCRGITPPTRLPSAGGRGSSIARMCESVGARLPGL